MESIITPQGELVVSELGQVNDTTRGQGSAHVESIITPQGEVVMLELDTTRGQGSAHVESMTSQGEPLIATIHTITPGNYQGLGCFPCMVGEAPRVAYYLGGSKAQ